VSTQAAPEEPPLVVIVPVYNEGENLARWWAAAAPVLPPGARVRVVYDFDEDNTVPVMRALIEQGAPIEPLKSRGRGVLQALVTGLRSVERGPILVSMADLSDDLTQVPRMLDAWREGAAVVVASRFMRGGRMIGGPPLKTALARLGSLSLHALAGFPVHDATNNFRLYDAAFVSSVEIESRGGFELAFELTLKAWQAGKQIHEVPTTWRQRTAGESRFNLRKWFPLYARLWGDALRHGLAPKGR
jgi:hypothetical protein